MKASRILAGMSAAAFAASLMSMVSFADAEATTEEIKAESAAAKTITVAENEWGPGNTYNLSVSVFGNGSAWSNIDKYSAISLTAKIENVTDSNEDVDVAAKDFSAQVYSMDSANWSWKSLAGDADETGTITIEGSTEELLSTKTATNSIGDFGIQLGLKDEVGGQLVVGDTVGFDVTYTLVGTLGDGNTEEVTYTLPYTTEDTGDYSAWGGQAYVPSKVYQLVPEGKGATVTIDYKVLREPDTNGGIYSLAKLALADGWGAAYDANIQQKYDDAVADEGADSALAKGLEAQLWKATSITDGFPAETSLTEDEVDKRKAANEGDPSINGDGFFVFYYEDNYTDTGSLTFHLSPECVKAFAAENDTGYGGSLFQVYNIDITSISIDAADVEPEEPVYEYNAFEMYTDNWTYQQMSQEDADARGMGFTVSAAQTTYTAESATAYYDAEGNLQYGEVPADTEAYKVSGATVWNVDIDGLADAVGAGTAGVKNDDGSDLSAADKMKLAQDAGIEISNVKLLIDGKEFYSIPDDKLLYGDIEGNGKIRLEVYNEYGETGNTSGEFFDKDRVEAIADEANAGTHYAVTFDITGIPEKAPDPVDTYSFTPADGYATTYTGNTGDVIDLAVALKQNGAPVADENVDWVFTSEAYSVQTIGAGENEVVVLPTDKDGISAGQYKCGSEAEIITVTATLENAEDYGNVSPVVFTIYQNIPDSQEDSSNADSSSSSSSSNTSSGGSSSSSSTTDNNPATGAAALGTVGILLAGAAMAVSKKKQ